MRYVTPPQMAVRKIFTQAIHCFYAQTKTGGVEPPAKGPRNRSWWYDRNPWPAISYFDWFMHETLNVMFGPMGSDKYPFPNKQVPLWCQLATLADTYVNSYYPAMNYGYTTDAQVGVEWWHSQITRSFFRTTDQQQPGILKLHCFSIDRHIMSPRTVECWEIILSDWPEDYVTWNNQPGLGRFLDRKTIADPGWYTFDTHGAMSVCLKLQDETIPPTDQLFILYFRTKEGPDPDYWPYFGFG